jgi:quercetin dioxygenase-like cupin family protein
MYAQAALAEEALMAYAGQILENPLSGERIVFQKTAADTDGELLAFELFLDPDGHVPGAHVHPVQEERFEVVKGTMKFQKGLKTIVAGAGDTVVVPPGTIHRFANAGDGPAHVLVEVRPALRMELLLETATALAREGRTNRKGMPRPLELALFVREFEREVRTPLVPSGFVRAVMAPLARLAARRGLDERYQRIPADLLAVEDRRLTLGSFSSRRFLSGDAVPPVNRDTTGTADRHAHRSDTCQEGA